MPTLPAALCRLYALVRMVEVVLTNLQRIDQLWPIFLSHVMELLSHPKTSIRNAAVDALAKAVLGALSHVNALADSGQDKVPLHAMIIRDMLACSSKCTHFNWTPTCLWYCLA